MSYYSFKVRSPREVVFPEWNVAIGEGVDAFCLTIQDLPMFQASLKEHNIELLEVNQLDNLSPIPAETSDPQFQNQTEVPLLSD
jgi:hypothetical protein